MNSKQTQNLINKFANKLDEMRASLSDEGYAQFIGGLTPEVLANPDLLSDLFKKCLAAGESENKTNISTPAHWPPSYNSNQACDMIDGPCCCGGWHSLDEDWVKNNIEKFGLAAGDSD